MIHEYTTIGEYIVTLSVDEGSIRLGHSGTISSVYSKEDYLSFGMITKAVLGSGIKEICT